MIAWESKEQVLGEFEKKMMVNILPDGSLLIIRDVFRRAGSKSDFSLMREYHFGREDALSFLRAMRVASKEIEAFLQSSEGT